MNKVYTQATSNEASVVQVVLIRLISESLYSIQGNEADIFTRYRKHLNYRPVSNRRLF